MRTMVKNESLRLLNCKDSENFCNQQPHAGDLFFISIYVIFVPYNAHLRLS